MAKLRKLKPSLCDKCVFMSGVKGNGCNYMAITGKSRIFKGRERVCPDGYCDKFKKGDKLTKRMKAWGHSDMTLIYSEKGGRVYEKRFNEHYFDIIDSSTDS